MISCHPHIVSEKWGVGSGEWGVKSEKWGVGKM